MSPISRQFRPILSKDQSGVRGRFPDGSPQYAITARDLNQCVRHQHCNARDVAVCQDLRWPMSVGEVDRRRAACVAPGVASR